MENTEMHRLFPRLTSVFGQVEEELQEQEFLDRCFQEMLEEEDQDWFIPSRDLPQGMGQLQQQLNGLSVGDGHSSEDILVRTSASALPGLPRSRGLVPESRGDFHGGVSLLAVGHQCRRPGITHR